MIPVVKKVAPPNIIKKGKFVYRLLENTNDLTQIQFIDLSKNDYLKVETIPHKSYSPKKLSQFRSRNYYYIRIV